MANIDRYREGYEDGQAEARVRDEQSGAEQMLKGVFKTAYRELTTFDEDYRRGYEDGLYGKEFDPGEED